MFNLMFVQVKIEDKYYTESFVPIHLILHVDQHDLNVSIRKCEFLKGKLLKKIYKFKKKNGDIHS